MRTLRYTPCAGSRRRPLVAEVNVGICPKCGVRTFINEDGTIQVHKPSNGNEPHRRRIVYRAAS